MARPWSFDEQAMTGLARRFVSLGAIGSALLLIHCGQSGEDSSTGSSSCAVQCSTGQSCVEGACQCSAGRSDCAGECVDVSSSAVNCGSCGTVCDAGLVCSLGACSDSCAAGTTQCGQDCVNLTDDVFHCGTCDNACAGGASCQNGQCVTPSGTGGADGSGGSGMATGGDGAGTGAASNGTGGADQGCDAGSSTTEWASDCPTAPYKTCQAGTWTVPGHSIGTVENGMTLRYESAHFAFYWKDGTNITVADITKAGGAVETLENEIWQTYFGSPMYMPEPYCDQTTKYKAGIHIDNTYPLLGGAYDVGQAKRVPGMWVGPGAMNDHWGLGHEFMHGVQSHWGGLVNQGGAQSNYIGWIYESHANFAPHQLDEYADNVHCSEMLANAPHLYLGSTRDRYCNWQFMEYLKDKECYRAVNEIWTTPNSNDPFSSIMTGRGWTISDLNDFIGEWAMHNVTWDYKVSAQAFRDTYGKLTDTSLPERRNRITRLEPLDDGWKTSRQFASPYYAAPQRFGYNVSELVPEAGSTELKVTFRGVLQPEANADFRWGLVATNAELTTARYSELQKGTDGELTFCITPGERVWLVVAGTPSKQEQIYWDKPYAAIRRYPYAIQVDGAWPAGFENGELAACPANTVRHENGGGCAPASLAASVYVGPYAQVLGGTVSGSARIEDQAIVLAGATVSGGTVGGLAVLGGQAGWRTYTFNVSGTATVRTTFVPMGYFEGGQGLSGSALLLGDVEYRGDGVNRSSGSFSGFVDSGTASMNVTEVTPKPPYAFR